MPYILVRHRVKNFTSWKDIFSDHAGARQASGSLGGILFRNANDPSDVFVLLEWDSLDQARQFVNSDELRREMERGGVTEEPEVYFLDEIAHPAM